MNNGSAEIVVLKSWDNRHDPPLCTIVKEPGRRKAHVPQNLLCGLPWQTSGTSCGGRIDYTRDFHQKLERMSLRKSKGACCSLSCWFVLRKLRGSIGCPALHSRCILDAFNVTVCRPCRLKVALPIRMLAWHPMSRDYRREPMHALPVESRRCKRDNQCNIAKCS